MGMLSIEEILKQRVKAFDENPAKYLERKGAEYNKSWAEAVQFFQIRLNQDRYKEKKEPLEFMPVRQKLIGIRELDDLRWFYKKCVEYSYTKDKITGKRNTFSRCFWGALK